MRGTGVAVGAPDALVLQFGSEVVAQRVQDALAESSAAMGAMLAALDDAGVPQDERRTDRISVSSWHDRHADEPPRFRAYQALTVHRTDVGTAGELIATVLGAGGDAARLHETSWQLTDDAELLVAARAAAVADATDRATQYAGLGGLRLGRVMSIAESEHGGGRGASQSVRKSASGPPLESGQQLVSISVEMTWELHA